MTDIEKQMAAATERARLLGNAMVEMGGSADAANQGLARFTAVLRNQVNSEMQQTLLGMTNPAAKAAADETERYAQALRDVAAVGGDAALAAEIHQQKLQQIVEDSNVAAVTARNDLVIRASKLSGDALAAQLLEFDTKLFRDRIEAQRAGLVDMVEFERVAAAERTKIIQDAADQQQRALQQSSAALQAWLDNQALSDGSTMGREAQFIEAQRQFAAALTAARGAAPEGRQEALAAVTRLAAVLLGRGAEINASGAAQTALEQTTRATIAALGRQLGLPGFAAGGLVTGGIPGRDSVPVLAMPGERIFSVSHSRIIEQLAANQNGDDRETKALLREIRDALRAGHRLDAAGYEAVVQRLEAVEARLAETERRTALAGGRR